MCDLLCQNNHCRDKTTSTSVLFNDLCSVSLYSFSGLAWGKQRQANFINVLKFHSGVPWSPLCCVLELSELPRNSYFWKKKTIHGCILKSSFWPFLHNYLFRVLTYIWDIYILPPHFRRWETLIVESSLTFRALVQKSVFRASNLFHVGV